MITRLLRKTAILAGVLLLWMSMVGPSAWAAPPGPSPPGGHLNITEVFVTFGPPAPGFLTIMGEDLDFGPGPLIVTLGNFDPPLTIDSATPTAIVALLPEGLTVAGDYLLTVSRGRGQSQNDEYDLTIGQPPQPEIGACCLPRDGGCVETTEVDCNSSRGDFAGEGTSCDVIECREPDI